MFEFIQKKNEKTSYIVGGDWSELKKAWDKYGKARDDQDSAGMERYALKINRLQERMGIEKTGFSAS